MSNIIRFIGDIHGNFQEYKRYSLHKCYHPSVQIGDFGVGFAGPYWHEQVNKFHSANNHRFIRGNHDNPRKCREEMTGYIADGTIENNIMFIGGAYSIDRAFRTESVDWWADEELSYQELETLIDIYAVVKPRIMVTHEAPFVASKQMFIDSGLNYTKLQIHTRTGQALQTMFEIYEPDLWIFGHWHQTKQTKIGNTTFQCLGELDYVDVDTDNAVILETAYI